MKFKYIASIGSLIKISHAFGMILVGHAHTDVVKKLAVLIREKNYGTQQERDFSIRLCQ
jgi:hypothetical protein